MSPLGRGFRCPHLIPCHDSEIAAGAFWGAVCLPATTENESLRAAGGKD